MRTHNETHGKGTGSLTGKHARDLTEGDASSKTLTGTPTKDLAEEYTSNKTLTGTLAKA